MMETLLDALLIGLAFPLAFSSTLAALRPPKGASILAKWSMSTLFGSLAALCVLVAVR